MAKRRYKLQEESSVGLEPVYLDYFDSDEELQVGDYLTITRGGIKFYTVSGRVLFDGDSLDVVLVRPFLGGH